MSEEIEVTVEVVRILAENMTDYPEDRRVDHWQVMVVVYWPNESGYWAESDALFFSDTDAGLADAVRDALGEAEGLRERLRNKGKVVLDGLC